MKAAGPFDALAHCLQAMPGIGPKTALRLASHLMQHDRDAARSLAHALSNALDTLHNCSLCNGFTDNPPVVTQDEPTAYVVCNTCGDASRDHGVLCIVESLADQLTIEQTLSYTGLYFVLMGRLSPLDAMGAKALSLEALIHRASQPYVREIIIANRFSADGEATAYVIAKHLKPLGKKITRLAKGIPVGIELEYVDLPTLAHALRDRRSET